MKLARFRPALIACACLALLLAGPSPARPEAPAPVRFRVEEFRVEGENPLSDRATRRMLAPFLGEHEGLARIEEAARSLEQALHARGHVFRRVIVPPQKAQDGVFTLRVLAFPLEDVRVEGNDHFPEETVLAALPMLRPDTVPNTRSIARALQLANEHPARHQAVFIRESEEPGRIDARVEVRDARPHQAYAAFSNTGTPDSGRTRVSLGYQASNLFRRDHTATLSYTTCPDRLSDVQQYGVHYRAPFYRLGAALHLFYTRSEVDQGTIAEFFEVSGEGTFMGAGLDLVLTPVGDYRHKLFLEIQDRDFENDVFFGRDPTPLVPDVRSRPVTLDYSGRLEGTWGEAGFHLGYARNLAHGANNDPAAYALTRAGADPHWDAFRYGAHLHLNLPWRFELRGRLSGQAADEPLIPGEQFGLGGLRSIRGFEEREVSGDTCEEAHLELWSPTLGPGLRLLGFLDKGRARLDAPIPGSPDKEHLSSLGLGLRWQWRRHLHLLVDGAYVTNGAADTASGDERIHFSLFLRF